MPFIASKMPPSTDSKPSNLSPSEGSSLVRRIVNSVIQRSNRKVFFDSPGMLDQSQHWGGLVIWTIAAGTTAALTWAFIGKVDQTVSASGTLEPLLGKVEVKSPSGGIVRDIWVKEGELVETGDRLATVENLGLKAQLDNITRQIALLSYENQLLNLLIDGQGSLPNTLPAPPANIASEDRIRSIQLSVQQTGAQLRQLRTRRTSQTQTYDLRAQMAMAMKTLFENGGTSRFNYLSAQDDVQQISSQISQTDEQINILIAQAGRQVSANTRQLLNLEAQQIDSKEENRNLLLSAFAPGRIFNLSVQPGSVIGAGSEVMRIIPEGGVRASVYLSNADLGFVSEGQDVKLSVSSFPAGEYGYLKANITRIGADSLKGSSSSQQQPANTYPVQVTLQQNPDKKVLLDRLKPGMQVTALIVVRKRPVISLLTDMFTKGSEDLQNSR